VVRVGVANFFSIGIDKTNTVQILYLACKLWASQVWAAYVKSQFSIFGSFLGIRVHMYDFLKFKTGLTGIKIYWFTPSAVVFNSAGSLASNFYRNTINKCHKLSATNLL